MMMLCCIAPDVSVNIHTDDTLENAMMQGLDWVYLHNGGLARMETFVFDSDRYSVETDNGQVTIRPLTHNERLEMAAFNEVFDALRIQREKEADTRKRSYGRRYR